MHRDDDEKGDGVRIERTKSGFKVGLSFDTSFWDESVLRLRKEMADLIREQADHETPLVATRLRQIADAFEAGEDAEDDSE